MTFSDEVKALAKLPPTPYPFFSLYLNARWDNEKQRERVRIFAKSALRESVSALEGLGADARRSLEQDVEGIEHYVRGLVNREWDDGYRGIAVFSCAGTDVHTLLRSHLPFQEALYCGNRPVLRPAAEQLHTGRSAVLCFVAGSSGRLFEFERGGLVREFRFHDEAFPGRHEQGGWSQGRYQRHVDDHLARNFKAIAGQLVHWADEKGVADVLLSGTESDLAVFEQHLPRRIGQRVSSRLRIDPSEKMDVVQGAVDSVLSRVRGQKDAEALDGLLEKAAPLGRAATGPEAVAEAVASGQIHTLYIDKSFRESGWVCVTCGRMGVKVPLGCPSCGAEVESLEVGEELVRRVLAADGNVCIVQDHAGLASRGGAAALLRFR